MLRYTAFLNVHKHTEITGYYGWHVIKSAFLEILKLIIKKESQSRHVGTLVYTFNFYLTFDFTSIEIRPL